MKRIAGLLSSFPRRIYLLLAINKMSYVIARTGTLLMKETEGNQKAIGSNFHVKNEGFRLVSSSNKGRPASASEFSRRVL
jgi:hypothetical protein